MKQSLCFLFIFLTVVQGFDDFENSPDCDNDFAIHALALIQSKMGEVPRIQQIEAILASCNKAMVQKLTEASVHLLHKGVIPTQLTEQLQQLAASQRKLKTERFQKMKEGVNAKLEKVIDGISSVSANDSLSGNEKFLWISTSLMQLNREEREKIHKILHRKEQSGMNAVPFNVAPIEPKKMLHSVNPITETQNQLFPNIPAAYSHLNNNMKDQLNSHSQLNLRGSQDQEVAGMQKVKLEIQPPAVLPQTPEEQHNQIFHKLTDSSSFGLSSVTVPVQKTSLGSVEPPSETAPSVFVKLNGESSRNLETNTHVFQKETPLLLGPPISALILNNGRPVTVGDVKHENKNIEDVDLLKTRNNIWTEAAKFLDQTTNIPEQLKKFIEQHSLKNGVLKGNPPLIAGLNIPANTFPLPTAAYEQLSKVIAGISNSKSTSETRRYLPSRQRDAILPEIRYGRAGRIHTDIGPESKIVIPSLPPEAAVPETAPKVDSRLAIGTGMNRQNKPVVTRFLGSEVPRESNTNDPKENKKIAEVGVEMERKEVFGGPTLTGGEFPTYPPPPPGISLSAGAKGPPLPLQGKTPDRFPKFPSIDTVDPEASAAFVPYKGPEEITGSRLQQKGDFNLQTGGTRRFVKIDILNEH